MTQVTRHRNDVILDIAQVHADFIARCDVPVLIAALREALDDVCLVAQKTVQAHDLLSAFADATQHVTTALLFALFLVVVVRIRVVIVVGVVETQNSFVDIVDFFLDTLNHGCVCIGDVVDHGVRDPVWR